MLTNRYPIDTLAEDYGLLILYKYRYINKIV